MPNFQIKKRYNFTTKAPAVLGGIYKNMLVEAIMSADEAVKYMDIMTLHDQIRAIEPMNMDANVCTYVKFKTLDGATKILAVEYINEDTIVEVKTVNIRVDILEANTDDILIIQERLKELGYGKFKIRTFD